MPKNLSELCGTLERPDGTEEPVDVKAGPNDTLSVNVTPKQPGKHFIHIKKGRRPIDGSPFEIMVLPASKKEPKAPKASPTQVQFQQRNSICPKISLTFKVLLKDLMGERNLWMSNLDLMTHLQLTLLHDNLESI